MSSDETPNVPARRDRREAVREKAAAVQARQRRGRVARIVVGSVVVTAIVVGAGVAVAWTLGEAASQPQLSPAVQDDGIVVDSIPSSVLASFSGGGAAEAPPESSDATAPDAAEPATPAPTSTQQPLQVEVYVDYLSEASSDFQLANAQQLSEWVSEGAAAISYHPVALLTGKSNGTKYSLRSAGAAACVATYAPTSFFAFNHKLLEQRPELDTDGLSDTDLAVLAQAVGVENPKRVTRCIENASFVPWAQKATARALAEPVAGTDAALTGPKVYVNGTPYNGDLSDAKEFAQFVLTLASEAYFSTPTPTPSVTPTTTPSPTP
ncbi:MULTISPECIES: DsbA family protein [Bacteria]